MASREAEEKTKRQRELKGNQMGAKRVPKRDQHGAKMVPPQKITSQNTLCGTGAKQLRTNAKLMTMYGKNVPKWNQNRCPKSLNINKQMRQPFLPFQPRWGDSPWIRHWPSHLGSPGCMSDAYKALASGTEKINNFTILVDQSAHITDGMPLRKVSSSRKTRSRNQRRRMCRDRSAIQRNVLLQLRTKRELR